MNKQEKELVKQMSLITSINGSDVFIHGVISLALYNSIMSTKPKTKTTKTSTPKPPAGFVPFANMVVSELTSIKTNQASDHSLLVQVIKDVDKIKVNQASDHALLVQVIKDVDEIKDKLDRNNIV